MAEPSKKTDNIQNAPLGGVQDPEREGREALPRVLASSVIRSTHKGESHGGVYLVDLSTGEQKQLLSWDDPTISWEGRGAERGLRGIAFYNDHVYLAASDEVYVFDRAFDLVDSFANPYLSHCHEINIYEDRLYLTSTQYDSVLEVDLKTHQFTRGFCFRMSPAWYAVSRFPRHLPVQSNRVCPPCRMFDPQKEGGPHSGDQLHLNSVVVDEEGMHVSGRQTGCLVQVDLQRIDSNGDLAVSYTPTPFGTHNVLPVRTGAFNGHVVMNDTKRDRVVVVDRDGGIVSRWPVVEYDEREIAWSGIPKDHARQAFGRGLVICGDIFIVGSSPATVTAYSFHRRDPIASINLTMDVRNSIHGLRALENGCVG